MTEITDEVFSSIGYCMIVNSIYNIVDQIFIQRSADGSLGNQATTVAFPLLKLL